MLDCLGYDGRISTRDPILWLVRTSCSCYHVSVVACLHACVYVCGVLPEKRQLVKNLIVQVHFCFRLDISSDRKMDLFSAFMNVTALKFLDIHFLTFGIGSNMYIRLMSTTSLCVNFIDFLKNRMTVSRSTFVKDLRRKRKWRSDGILTYCMLKVMTNSTVRAILANDTKSKKKVIVTRGSSSTDWKDMSLPDVIL